MTPRDLSAAVIQRRLLLIEDLLRVGRGLGRVPRDRLDREPVTRLAVERILTQLVELATDANGHVAATVGDLRATDYRSTFEAVARIGVISTELAGELKSSAGLRNVLVHEYVNVDPDIVAASFERALVVYAEYSRRVSVWLGAQS